MDQFEEMQKMMMGLSPEEKMKKVGELKAMCTCGGCPSYTDCNREKEELLFCSMGKSKDCVMNAKGCLCPTCPVTGKMGLAHAYYCVRGTEREQRGM